MKNSIIVFCFVIFFSCSNTTNNNSQENKDSLNKTSRIENKLNIKANIDSLLIGIWAENENANALFWIDGKHLYYTEDQSSPITYRLRQCCKQRFYLAAFSGRPLAEIIENCALSKID